MSVAEGPPPVEQRPAEELRCPSCLSLHRPGQRFCLECGARLAEPGLPPPEAARGAPLPPVRQLALALAAAVLVLGGAAIAYVFTRDDSEPERVVLTSPMHSIPPLAPSPAASATSPLDPGLTDTGTTLPVVPTESIPEFTDPASTETLPTTDEDPGTTDDGIIDEEAPDEWPAGLDAWAAILISKEVDDFDAAYMEDLRSDAGARGLDSLGILASDNHSSLNPGFRVLYQGPYDTRAEADAAAVRAQRAGYDFAYPRRVAP